MIENLLIASFLVGIASLFYAVLQAIFVQKQSAVRIPVRMEDDNTIRRIRIDRN